jgi:hypothetical protein
MDKRGAIVLLGLLLCLSAPSADADIPPPPGLRERALAEQITKAGYNCPRVKEILTVQSTTASQFDKKGLVAVIAVCDNGSRFLVANPRRPSPGSGPSPTPVVEPWR